MKLRVWWIPQIPMQSFYYPVKSVRDGALLLDVLAKYDKFEYENNVKPDYSNVGGLQMFEDGEWCDWTDENGENLTEDMIQVILK